MSSDLKRHEAIRFGMGLIVGERKGYANKKRKGACLNGPPGQGLAALIFEAAKSLPLG